jgi:hypothetical protein
MTRRAFASKQELTPPPARLDQRSNLSPCSPHGPYAFSAKRNQIPFMPQGHTAKPEKLALAASKGRAFATKRPANAGRFNFRANRISAVNTD